MLTWKIVARMKFDGAVPHTEYASQSNNIDMMKFDGTVPRIEYVNQRNNIDMMMSQSV